MDKFHPLRVAMVLVFAIVGAQTAEAGSSFSFVGNFTQDTDVQFFTFSISSDATTVDIRTLSRNGGSNAAGQTIPSGGFDPYLMIFNQADGASVFDTNNKPASDEAIISNAYSFPYGTLQAGNYLLALTQYDNIAAGSNLSEGFANDLGLYTPPPTLFNGRDGHWAVDFTSTGDGAVITGAAPVPIPAAFWLFGSSLAGLGFFGKWRKRYS